MKKIDFTKLNSANVSVDNLVDEARVYDINATCDISGNSLNNINNGYVIKDGVQVATFSMYSSFTPSFKNATDPEMCNILMAITTFIADVKNELNSNPIEI